MAYLLIPLIWVCMVSSVFAYPAHSTHWQHRSVLYFAPSEDEYVKQFLLDALINDCGIKERDIIPIVVTKSDFTKPSWVKDQFNIDGLYEAYEVTANQHIGILIGKDGSEKMRWNDAVDWQEVTQLVDTMPIRQKEMKNAKSVCAL